MGVPARIVKYRFENDQIEQLQKIEWWNFENDKLSDVEINYFNIGAFVEKYI